MTEKVTLLDPTPETDPVRRQRLAPPDSLEGLCVALLDISKARGDIFIDQVALRLEERGVEVRRYAKPTSGRVAPAAIADAIAAQCGVVVEALAD